MHTSFKNIRKEYKHKFKFNVYKDYEFNSDIDSSKLQIVDVNFNIPIIDNVNKKVTYYTNILKDCIYGSDFLNKIFPSDEQNEITKVTYIGIYKKNYAYGIKPGSVEIEYLILGDTAATIFYDEVSVVDNR